MSSEQSPGIPQQLQNNNYNNAADRLLLRPGQIKPTGSVESSLPKELVFVNVPIKRVKSQEDISQHSQREQGRQNIQYVQQQPIKDKSYIEYPRFTLLARKKERHYLPEDTHNAYQNIDISSELLGKLDKLVIKTDNQQEKMEAHQRCQTVQEQLGRITYLEDRMELLQKELANQAFHLKYKHKQSLNYQADFNRLRDETIAHHARIAAMEEETKKKDLTKVQEEIEDRETEIKTKEKEIDELNEDVFYWKEKALVDEACISIVTGLKYRMQELQTENNRLKDVLFSDEQYADIRNVMSGSTSTQQQQDILEETDNLLREYYESSSYDQVFNEKSSTRMNATKAKIAANNRVLSPPSIGAAKSIQSRNVLSVNQNQKSQANISFSKSQASMTTITRPSKKNI